MNLYRIDLTGPQGQRRGSVTDMLGTVLYRRWSVARTAAIENAARRDCFAHITRISGGGQMKRVGIVAPGSKTVGRC